MKTVTDFAPEVYCYIYIKVKVKVFPRTDHEGLDGEQMYSSTPPSTSALDVVGDQRLAPAALSPERSGTHCTGGWVGHRAGLDGSGKFRYHRDSIPRQSSP